MTLNCPSPRLLLISPTFLRWALVVTVAVLLSGPARSEVSVSVRLTAAGVAVGGVAWALSLSWTENVGLLAPPTAALVPSEPTGWAEEDDGLMLYVPLFTVPLP